MAVAGLAAGAPLAPPSELVLDSVAGFELVGAAATDLDFATYAEREPNSVDHLAPESDEAIGMLAAIEVWTDAVAETSIVIELVRAIDEASATTFVDQAAANSIAVGLAATDPPFGGAWSYSGGLDDSWTNVVSWNQGPYAVTLTQLALVETDRDAIDAAAVRQAEIILEATGAEVSEDAAVADAPPPPTEATTPAEAPVVGAGEDTDGFPVGIVIAVLLAVLVAAGIVIAGRRRAATSTEQPAEAERTTVS